MVCVVRAVVWVARAAGPSFGQGQSKVFVSDNLFSRLFVGVFVCINWRQARAAVSAAGTGGRAVWVWREVDLLVETVLDLFHVQQVADSVCLHLAVQRPLEELDEPTVKQMGSQSSAPNAVLRNFLRKSCTCSEKRAFPADSCASRRRRPVTGENRGNYGPAEKPAKLSKEIPQSPQALRWVLSTSVSVNFFMCLPANFYATKLNELLARMLLHCPNREEATYA